MALFSPPPVAPQRGDRATFSNRVDAFLTWLVALIPQLETFLGNLTALAAGGANSFAYTFDSATDDTDPGQGKLRFGSTAQNTANVLRIDALTNSGADITPFLATLAAGTSNIKGSVRLQKFNDVSRWMVLDITGVSGTGGYRNLTVQVRAASSATPFSAPDTLMVYFDRTGDKGTGGNTPTQAEMRAAIGTLPIENGGTGANTAGGAVAALGAVPAAGGTMTGNLIFNNGVGLQGKDASGTIRSYLTLDSGNHTTLVNAGGQLIRMLSQDRSRVIWQLDDIGTVTQVGASVQKALGANGTGRILHAMLQADGKTRYQFTLEADESPALVTYDTGAAYTGTIKFNNGGVAASGAVSGATVSATSDEALKSNWRAAPDDLLDEFAELEKVGLFTWNEDGRQDGGVGAQSLHGIAPWAVYDIDKSPRVNHSAINTVLLHQAAQRIRRIEAALLREGVKV